MLILAPTSRNIQKIRENIKRGEVVVYPTDTLYGLGVDAFNKQAIKRLFEIKGRNFNKPVSIMVSSLKEIRKLAWLNKKQENIVKMILPGPFTVLLRKKKGVLKILTAGGDRVGLRIPNSKICMKLSRNLPITATSANRSGQKPTGDFEKLKRIFANQVNLILKGKKLKGRPSIVIDLTKEPFMILRG